MFRRAQQVEVGAAGRHLASGIHRLADAAPMAAPPDLAEILLRLLTTPNLTAADLDHRTRTRIDSAWTLLVRTAPHLEI